MRLTVFLWLFAVLLVGCRAPVTPTAVPVATPAPTVDVVAQGRAEFAELESVIAGRLDALAGDGDLLLDDDWRRASVSDLREAALLAESLAMRSTDGSAALRAVGGAYGWLADGIETRNLASIASALFALEEARK